MSTDDIVGFITARLDEDIADVSEGAEWPKWNIAPSRMSARIRRVLRGVEAKRRIVEMWTTWLDGYTGDEWRSSDHARRTLRLLASEWSTHDDFRPEWTL